MKVRIGHVNGGHLWYGIDNGYSAAFEDTEEQGDEDNYAVAVIKKSEHEAVVEGLKAELLQYHRMAAKGVWIESTLKETMRVRDAEIAKLKSALVDIANKNTCWRLYQTDKYKSYEDGWEGVAEFAAKVLKEIDAIENEDEKGKGLG